MPETKCVSIMQSYIILCLLPLSSVLGALLGGFRPLDLSDNQHVLDKLKPILDSHKSLTSFSVERVEQQTLYQLTNYKVYQKIPNTDSLLCAWIACPTGQPCRAPEPCNNGHAPANQAEPIRKELGRSAPKRPLLGGYQAGSVNDVQEAVDFAVEKHNSMSNNLFRMVSESVTDIKKQVIAGMRYNFTVKLVTSGCRNSHSNMHKNLDQCGVNEAQEQMECHFSVLHMMDNNGKWVYTLADQQCKQPSRTNQLLHMKPLGGDDLDKCHYQFQEFKAKYQRNYANNAEEGSRYKVFCENLKRVKDIQKQMESTSSARYGITKFADMSEAEFRKFYLTPKWDLTTPRPWMKSASPANPSGDAIPDSFDWVQKGKVTPVKNQGSCGSCWAFSTTGNIEGQWAIASNSLVSLSEQELVDCDKLDSGCEGGLPSNAYESIMRLGGMETESEYAYKGVDEKCIFNRSGVAVKISGAVNISSDETEMKAWLYKNGPISIGINAFAMQFYMGGVSHPWKIFCSPSELDHGVLITGYGVTDSNEPYWIIKNSWGADWGEKGYYWVYRGKGVCGLNTMCTSATIN